MSWYYAEGNQKVGPIEKTELFELVKSKKINSKTRVWSPGMPNWEEIGRLAARRADKTPQAQQAIQSADQAQCSECGQAFALDDMIRFEDAWVCATCKPVFVQKIREGLQVAGELDTAGFWIRFGAIFIDGLILSAVNMITHIPLSFFMVSTGNNTGQLVIIQLITTLFQFIIPAVYTTWFLGKYGATPGKMACKIKVVRSDGEPVGYGRALGRHFAKGLSWIILCIGFLMAAFDDQRRTLHDRICDTRVVRK
jgi:uncharacterized RDD family membrane protein YckC